MGSGGGSETPTGGGESGTPKGGNGSSPQAELAVGVPQAVAQGTAVAVGVAARQVQCSIETHVLCNSSTHHNVWYSMCI